MVQVNASIDVPDLEAGLAFYKAVFELQEIARPMPTMAILKADNLTLCMHQKSAGTLPYPGAIQSRDYQRHWTPVHLDFHVAHFEKTLRSAERAGAVVEMTFLNQGPKDVAFCADIFGNGFCIIST